MKRMVKFVNPVCPVASKANVKSKHSENVQLSLNLSLQELTEKMKRLLVFRGPSTRLVVVIYPSIFGVKLSRGSLSVYLPCPLPLRSPNKDSRCLHMDPSHRTAHAHWGTSRDVHEEEHPPNALISQIFTMVTIVSD